LPIPPKCIDIWFARGLHGRQHASWTRASSWTFTATPAQLLEWCRDRRLTDAKTLTCMVWLQNVVSGAWSLDWRCTAPHRWQIIRAMKVLNLQCAHQHGFEGWFASEEDFQDQLGRGLVECPMCGDTITKMLSAPRLNLGAAREPNPRPSSRT
jgi:hypothetical protein